VMNFCVICFIFMCSILLYSFVFFHNMALLRRLRMFNDGYSVAAAFQIKENLAVLKAVFIYFCSTLPIIFFSLLLFTLYFTHPSFVHVALSDCIILVDLCI
ncbi:hypothetical protein PMAYCL1PPCAC_17243, partial [Pristionchus mayeri]